MQLIIGLGNPGEEYSETRHNLGYRLLDLLCDRHGCSKERREGGCLVRNCRMTSGTVLLARTGTYMNVSGPPVRVLIGKLEVPLDQVLVAYDDADLEFGQIKLKKGGGSGGHKGVDSILRALGEDGFLRLRMGVGRPDPRRELADWLLEPFRKSERPGVEEMLATSADAADCLQEQGLTEAMNRYNRAAEA